LAGDNRRVAATKQNGRSTGVNVDRKLARNGQVEPEGGPFDLVMLGTIEFNGPDPPTGEVEAGQELGERISCRLSAGTCLRVRSVNSERRSRTGQADLGGTVITGNWGER
jgi:hypothetical protein